MNTLDWAEAFYNEHVACTFGHDSGPIVDEFLVYAGARPGEAWCASFVSYCAHKGLVDAGAKEPADPPFKSASSQAIRRWAEDHDRLFTDPTHLNKCTGALGGWTDRDDASHGHVFLVSERLTNAGGEIVSIRTVEGNSDSAPENAVNELERQVPTDSGHSIWFVDLTGIPGCNWWRAG